MVGKSPLGGAAAMREASKLPRSLASKMQQKKAYDLLNVIGGVKPQSTGANIARGALQTGINAPANVLGTIGTGLQYRAPQLTTLGLLNQQQENK